MEATMISVAVKAASDEAKKLGKTFDGQKIGEYIRDRLPAGIGGATVLTKDEAEKLGRDACSVL